MHVCKPLLFINYREITTNPALPYITWGLIWDSKIKNDKGIPTFLYISIVYEKLNAQIFEGLSYTEIQLDQVKLKPAK